MKVAIVHSFYSTRAAGGGENNAVVDEVEALRRRGHRVLLIDQSTDVRERARLYPFEAAITVATGVGRSPLKALKHFEPDVVHVHNLFPNYGDAGPQVPPHLSWLRCTATGGFAQSDSLPGWPLLLRLFKSAYSPRDREPLLSEFRTCYRALPSPQPSHSRRPIDCPGRRILVRTARWSGSVSSVESIHGRSNWCATSCRRTRRRHLP